MQVATLEQIVDPHKLGDPAFTIVIPCFDAQFAIEEAVQSAHRALKPLGEYELIVVDDGSTDKTPAILSRLALEDRRLHVFTHARHEGDGAAIKTAMRASHANLVAIADAHASYPMSRLAELIQAARHADMVVGTRSADDKSSSRLRSIPKFLMQRYCSFIAGESIPDIHSGLRVFRKDVASRYLSILPDRFGFTTTLTLAMLADNHRVVYLPVGHQRHLRRPKFRPIRDALNFIQFVLRTATHFAPMRVFMPVAIATGFGCMLRFAYDAFMLPDLTNWTLMLFFVSLNLGTFALLADMLGRRESLR